MVCRRSRKTINESGGGRVLSGRDCPPYSQPSIAAKGIEIATRMSTISHSFATISMGQARADLASRSIALLFRSGGAAAPRVEAASSPRSAAPIIRLSAGRGLPIAQQG